ncbi:MAG: phosphodiester glycosidase family protein [Candidatus Cryptobacteroides sp.]
MTKLKCLFSIIALGVALAAAPGCVDKQGNPSSVTAKPAMSSLEPAIVSSGQTAQVIGSGFPDGIIEDLSVLVGSVKAEILSCVPDCITIRVPELDDGVHKVVVRCSGQVLQGLSFTYISDSTDDGDLVLTLLEACPVIKSIDKGSAMFLSTGIYDTEVTAQFTNGSTVDFYVLSIDLEKSGAALKVALPGNVVPTLSVQDGIPTGWSKATLSSMCASLDGKGGNVVAMMNGDFWNTTSIIPKGPVHFRGQTVSTFWDNTEDKPQQGVNFVGITPSGEMEIDVKATYNSSASVHPELTGAGVTLVRDGKSTPTGNSTVYPRCSVGYTTDGKVYFLVVDGRTDKSEGLCYADMSEIFVSLGCDRAANLDGGGSAQLLVRNPANGAFEIRNNPSDGKERAVINAWAVVL